MAQRRSVPASVPSVKSRGKRLPEGGKLGVPEALAPGSADASDSSDGHDKGAGKSKPATAHKGPDLTK